ncbi:hypothetical protein EUGRSUZ_G00928 [Eucalyptus grandis]|uniref:Uncharacterized protein n=2 Tax=Eucalyptus grandis TaxID=71139 RepID=A0ACC3K1D3_EUCGR|nr:hypothetical protein EUGRSUZ_G00928 [Eucalyptus grandis]
MKVEVQSKKLVKPSTPTPNQSRKLGLSFIDDLVFSKHVGIVYFYRARESMHEIHTFQRLHRFEESLSETLALFYPLAGRYVEDGLFIDCNDQGVEVIQAKVDGTLDQLLQGDLDRDLLNSLSKFPLPAANNPLVVVQVNSFNCGGLAMSLRFSHKIGDMYTMAMFMNSWATACRSGIQEVVSPNFELPSLFPVKQPVLIQWPTPPFRKKFELARLKFSGQALSRLKAASGASNSSDSIANNSQRVQLKTPTNACGNFFAQITTPLAVEETEPSFNGILNQLGDAHRNAKLKYAAIADAGVLCSVVADSFRDFVSVLSRDGANVILISSWCGFPLYDSDFGWGKPDMVSNSSPPLRSVGLVDSPVDGGIDAWITLNQDEMALFKQDPDIVACTS